MVSEEGFITPNSKKRKQGRRANQPPSFENQLQRTKNELDVDGWFESVKSGQLSITHSLANNH
jgi:hypothetical protein